MNGLIILLFRSQLISLCGDFYIHFKNSTSASDPDDTFMTQ